MTMKLENLAQSRRLQTPKNTSMALAATQKVVDTWDTNPRGHLSMSYISYTLIFDLWQTVFFPLFSLFLSPHVCLLKFILNV